MGDRGRLCRQLRFDRRRGWRCRRGRYRCVRAGRRVAALAEQSGERDRLGWPPQEHILRVVLRREHWEWVLTQLDRWESYERDTPSTEARKLIRSALDSA